MANHSYCEITTHPESLKEPGVATSVEKWLKHFGLKTSAEKPNKMLIIWPDDPELPICSVSVEELIERQQIQIPYMVAYISSDYRAVRNFLSCGITAVVGPAEKDWPNQEYATWCILTSAREVRSPHWQSLMTDYYAKNWPALYSPAELFCKTLNYNYLQVSELPSLGLMPAKLLKLENSFEKFLRSETSNEWIKFIEDVAAS